MTAHGYSVTTASDGETALAVFKQDPLAYDLVLSDISMHKLSGDRLAREILAIRPNLPILLATGFSNHVSEEPLLQNGVRGLLQKPISEEQLLQAVREALAPVEEG